MKSGKTIRIATRGSALALAQANLVKQHCEIYFLRILVFPIKYNQDHGR